ncbi:putative hnh endonuclease [Bacillus phage CP-51]|uniref:Putative hnh endonuclease n=1 Tax=Bacillus phage CP-51 TaxID=1391188 RepID=A0A068EU52_9CAUD|nr:putative hnh endonuclease [Bacillus phage CP-51]AID50526.1 putative hnh endonuclease [Bacillus phage CP-51]
MRNNYYIQGDTTVIEIQRRDGSVHYCYIDTEDLFRLKHFGATWCLHSTRKGKYYAVARTLGSGKMVSMHRFLLGANEEDVVDHRDGDGMNNRKDNIRLATYEINARNIQHRKKSSNPYPGVVPRGTGFNVYLGYKGKNNYIGRYQDLDEAIEARKKAEDKYWGDSR